MDQFIPRSEAKRVNKIDPGLSFESPILTDILKLWQRAAAGKPMPASDDIRLMDIAPALLPHIILIDVVHQPKLRFYWRLIGSHITTVLNRDSTGACWDEIYQADALAALSLRTDWILKHRAPLRSVGHSTEPGRDFDLHEALYLPLSSDGVTVDMIMTGSVYTLRENADVSSENREPEAQVQVRTRELYAAKENADAARVEVEATNQAMAELVAKLQESEQRFRDFAEVSADFYWEIDAELRYSYLSLMVKDITGFDGDTYIGRTPREVIGADFDAQNTLKYVENCMEARLSFRDVEFFRPSPLDGERLWLRTSGAPFFDGNGTFCGYRGSSAEITASKRAEDELRARERTLVESQRNLADAQRIGQIGHWRIPPVLGQAEWSAEMYRIWGRKEDGDPVNLGDILAAVHPEDRHKVIAARESSIAENEPYGLEFRIVRPDGEIRHVRNDGRPEFDHNGNLMSVFGITQDITQQKLAEYAIQESEQNFRAIAEGSPVPLLITRRDDGIILYANAQVGPVLGLSAKELEGLPIAGFFWRQDERGDRMRRLEAQGLLADELLDMRRADGARISTLHSLHMIQYAGEDAILGSFQDVTERLRLEEQLRQAQKMEAVGQLTGGVAHDFNNLMAVILGNAEILERRIDDNDIRTKRAVGAIIRAIDRGASLTKRLLAFSRKQSLSPALVDANSLIAGCADMLRRTLGGANILRVEVTPDNWPSMIDPHQLEDALLNLAINARDAMPGGGLIKICTANVTLNQSEVPDQQDIVPGDYIEIAVSDSGIGIPVENLEKVFEPFFTTKAVGEGSGLGLSMVYGFIKQSKGHITINSEVDRGTIVKLYLPRSTECIPADVVTQKPIAHQNSSERILVVEDDPEVREVSVVILQEQGYHVVDADNGEAAITMLKTGQKFDLLFTDILLPGSINGIETAEAALRIQPSLRVIFTTGYSEDALTQFEQFEHAAAIVKKPYRWMELLEIVRATLDKDRV